MINWLYTTKILSGLRIYLSKKLRQSKIAIVYYRDPERSKIFDIVNKIKKSSYGICVTNNEAMQIAMGVLSTKN
jgi:hypothetical protein